MRVYNRVFGQPTVRQTIGIAGESDGAAKLIIDVSIAAQAYPAAWYTIIFKPPHGLAGVLEPILQQTDGRLEYVLPAAVFSCVGNVSLEVQARNENSVLKTARWDFYVASSLSSGCNPPRKRPPCGHHNDNCCGGGGRLDHVLDTLNRNMIVGAHIDDASRHLFFDTIGGEPIDAGGVANGGYFRRHDNELSVRIRATNRRDKRRPIPSADQHRQHDAIHMGRRAARIYPAHRRRLWRSCTWNYHRLHTNKH